MNWNDKFIEVLSNLEIALDQSNEYKAEDHHGKVYRTIREPDKSKLSAKHRKLLIDIVVDKIPTYSNFELEDSNEIRKQEKSLWVVVSTLEQLLAPEQISKNPISQKAFDKGFDALYMHHVDARFSRNYEATKNSASGIKNILKSKELHVRVDQFNKGFKAIKSLTKTKSHESLASDFLLKIAQNHPNKLNEKDKLFLFDHYFEMIYNCTDTGQARHLGDAVSVYDDVLGPKYQQYAANTFLNSLRTKNNGAGLHYTGYNTCYAARHSFLDGKPEKTDKILTEYFKNFPITHKDANFMTRLASHVNSTFQGSFGHATVTNNTLYQGNSLLVSTMKTSGNDIVCAIVPNNLPEYASAYIPYEDQRIFIVENISRLKGERGSKSEQYKEIFDFVDKRKEALSLIIT